MNEKFINLGHGNLVAADRIVSVVSPDSSPIKRLVQDAKEEGRAIDITGGKKTRAVLIADTGHVILCPLQCETVASRLNGAQTQIPDTEEDE
jgi:regulator of extracellular matrix RemA (YlzA/DUF370 family)